MRKEKRVKSKGIQDDLERQNLEEKEKRTPEEGPPRKVYKKRL